MYSPPPKGHVKWLWTPFCCLAFFLHGTTAHSQSIDSAAYNKVQAAYVFKIASYVSWPRSGSSKNFSICILDAGEELFAVMSKSIEGRDIGGQPIVVFRYTLDQWMQAPAHQRICRIVYVNQEMKSALDTTVNHDGEPELWVASPMIAAPDGVLFELALEEGRIAIYVNRDLLAHSRLTVAAPLLSVARPR